MDIGIPDRRSVLQLIVGIPALAGGSAANAALDGRSPSEQELGLAPGLVHLNTASAGPIMCCGVPSPHGRRSKPTQFRCHTGSNRIASSQ